MQSDIDFTTFEKFQPYADRTYATVVNRGNMPLAKLVYDAFHASPGEETLANFLGRPGLCRARRKRQARCGPAVRSPIPGRIACSGRAPPACPAPAACTRTPTPGRSCRPRTRRSPATLTDANTAQPTFNAASDGTYVLSLVVGNDSAQSAPKLLTLVVNNALTPAPSAIRFADIKAILQDGFECARAATVPPARCPRRSISPTRTAMAMASSAVRRTTPGTTPR